METSNKPIKRFKKKKRKVRKFRCELCERVVIRPKEILTRKNYSHGKKSKVEITKIHRHDGGCLVELKRKKDENKI